MAQTPVLNILPNCQISSIAPLRAQTASCRKPQAGTVMREGGSAAVGWREVGAAAGPAELLAQTSTSTRRPPRWAGGAEAAAKGFSTGRPPLCLFSCPHPPSHMSPASYRTFSSPPWTRGWPDPRDEAPPGSLFVCWCSELRAGSVFGGNNQLNPECCPLLTRRSPSQRQQFHRGTVLAFHPQGLYTEES